MAAALLALFTQIPIPIAVLSAMGMLRIINTALFAFLNFYVKTTPSTSDDEELQKFEAHWAYKLFATIITVAASIPVPTKVSADSLVATDKPATPTKLGPVP